MPIRDTIHCLVYGDSGGGKSTFAATFPRPMIVFGFDPIDKLRPYMRGGTPTGWTDDAHGTPCCEVLDSAGNTLVRVERYFDTMPEQPDAYSRFLKRMTGFASEYSQWATAVLDSVTFAELAARSWSQFVLNKGAKEPRQWFSFSTDAIEQMLLRRWSQFPLNTVVLAHVDEDKDEMHGTFVRSPKMPGQRLRKGVMAAFGETYRAYVGKNEEGAREYLLQTQADNMWNAASQIFAPNPCAPHYLALWSNHT